MASNPKSSKKGAPQKSTARETASSGSTRKQLMENEVLEHATRLFAEKGFAGTNLQDVATSMGLKRPALYYYFKSKDELLERLIFEATGGPANDLRAIAERADEPAADRLHAMAHHMVRWIATHTDRFLLLVKSESDLSESSSKAFNDGRRAALDAVTTLIEDGIASGEFRTMDPRIASFGIWGICNWVAFWYQPGGHAPIETVADQLADMAVASVQRAENRGSNALSPQTALAAVRESLDRLEHSLHTVRGHRPMDG